MTETFIQPALQQVSTLSLIPVGLKEAALDSPTFRATAVHFSDQVEIIEKWLEAYVKSTSKLVHDVSSVEDTINTFLNKSIPPANISEAVLDHDYTLLAMRRFGEGSREWWSQILGGMKKMEITVIEPIRAFMSGELRNFKDARKYLEQSQKAFDSTLSRYLSQSKTKEPSALREDAFQTHETRKAYLKASLDFCLLAPQLRSTIDKLLVKVSTDQWKEMKKSKESAGLVFTKYSAEMDRVKGWSREMEVGESIFRRELQIARREIGESVSAASRPSRELEDYNVSTVAFLSSKGPSGMNLQDKQGVERAEKQGWLFLRTISGKPARTFWVRRWFFVKNGIFGWLVQGAQSGGVEESEKIGVLLCNVKPAVQEDRRFCFEVKTKNSTILVQAETQAQLMEWLETFEVAKNKAIEASANDRTFPGGIDPAFAITPPSIPEFAAKGEGHAATGSEDIGSSGLDRSSTLPIPDSANLAVRNSFDVSGPRRSTAAREEGESGRDHATRIMQKLDLHRKSVGDSLASSGAAGGIASLISASHNILPAYSTPAITQVGPNVPGKTSAIVQPNEIHTSTLAPATLANPPAPTNLSKVAVVVSGERGISIGGGESSGGMPGGIMANLWGSSNWGFVNRLEKGDKSFQPSPDPSIPSSPGLPATTVSDAEKSDTGLPSTVVSSINTSIDPAGETAPAGPQHRKAMSVDAEATHMQSLSVPQPEIFPPNYPAELKTQEAQFRMLFPNVPREDKLVLVFRATWNPNEQQEFPGRVYVTPKEVYFYSHHLGLVLITSVSLESIDEVTAAPGRDCDFIFCHLNEKAGNKGYTRITIKIFLEPLRLLQSRLNFLVDNARSDIPLDLEGIMAELIKLETEDPTRSPSMESWEDVSMNTPVDDGTMSGRSTVRRDRDLKATIHVERGLHQGRRPRDVTKFQLPSQPVVYEPEDFPHKAIERHYEISPKALFHVMFGDRSAVFQLLYHERRAQRIAQGPWVHLDQAHMRRDFHFQIDYVDILRRHRQANVIDYQVIDILNDHVCYVITDKKTPWHLPHHDDFMLVLKIVITHVAKSKCQLAVYTKVEWTKAPTFSKGLVERQALDDLDRDAIDLGDVISDQVRKLGPHSHTKKAIHIFGHVGQQTSVSMFSASDAAAQSKQPQIIQRTLTSIFLETTSSIAESVMSSIMLSIFAVLKKIWEVSSANSIILGFLVFSILINAFLTGKDSWNWWTERNAANFMKRLGVGPNIMMSKAVYVKDLDAAFSSASMGIMPGLDIETSDPSRCYTSFMSLANSTDMDASYHYAGMSFSEAATKSTARRLRRTRQHLGTYRHDLLVAMRVVNSVEREMLRAEWENWVLDEVSRCRQVELMLGESTFAETNSSNMPKNQEMFIEGEKIKKLEKLRVWHQEYCGSCSKEQERLFKGGKTFATAE